MIEYAELEDSALQKLAADGDSYAEEELVSRYMRLVRICARPLFLAGGESEDLIQEGMFGLLSAVRQYNNEHNASFKTFAEWCIRNRLRSAVKSASSLKHDPLNNRVPLESILSDESQTQAVACAELFQKSPEEQVLARENKKYTEQLYLSLVSMLSKYEKDRAGTQALLGLLLNVCSASLRGSEAAQSPVSPARAARCARRRKPAPAPRAPL